MTPNIKAKILSDLCCKASKPSHPPGHRNLSKGLNIHFPPARDGRQGGAGCNLTSHIRWTCTRNPFPRAEPATTQPSPATLLLPGPSQGQSERCLSCFVPGSDRWPSGVKATQAPVPSHPDPSPACSITPAGTWEGKARREQGQKAKLPLLAARSDFEQH